MKNMPMLTCLAAIAGALASFGCEEPRIERYRVPRVDPAPRPPLRTLAAIVPRRDMVWFAKLMGPSPKVEAERKRFEEFVQSLRFPTHGPRVEWALPEGWTVVPSKGMRFATFAVGKDLPRMEITLVPLGPEAGSILENVNRWRRELGLGPIGEPSLARYLRRLEVDGGPALLVELSAAEQGESASSPPAARPLTWSAPPDWRELSSPGPMRTAAFRVQENGDAAEVTIVGLGGSAGGISANVNRWRGQIGLSPAGEAEIMQGLVSVPLSSGEAKLVDLVGEHERILVAIVPHGEMTWFFKMQGPKDLVGRRRGEFESFIRSARFHE